MYYAFNEDNSKDKLGLNKRQNELTKEMYLRALEALKTNEYRN